jgi:pyridoxine 5'-phosphate synthase PdxJ
LALAGAFATTLNNSTAARRSDLIFNSNLFHLSISLFFFLDQLMRDFTTELEPRGVTLVPQAESQEV